MNMNDIQMLIDIAGMTAELIEKGRLAPVVRCKDCKYYHGINEGCGARDFYPPSGDWFCADGERRDYVKPVTESATDWNGIKCE